MFWHPSTGSIRQSPVILQPFKPERHIMDSFTATGIAEGFIEADSQDQVIEAWQTLIDSGLAWQLQGWFGRTAQRLIEDGICNPAN
jgi:hypothetical protein